MFLENVFRITLNIIILLRVLYEGIRGWVADYT